MKIVVIEKKIDSEKRVESGLTSCLKSWLERRPHSGANAQRHIEANRF
jgi:hypothetical protein